MDKLDYKKEFRSLYLPAVTPSKILVPKMAFLMADGKGDPNLPGGEYAQAVSTLYALTYSIKMSKLGRNAPAGYFEYVVPPLEGLWWYADGRPFRLDNKADFCWTAMIRQPAFITQEVLEWACLETSKKKPEIDTVKTRLADFDEGLCVQCMHIGPYDSELETVEKMNTYMNEQGLVPDFSDTRRHHEIYLSDPRKTDPAKMKTVVRHPVR
jgi:hypothetical protein